MTVIKSISYDQTEIINDIIKLHLDGNPIELDPTYSIGNFYKNNNIEDPIHKFDINPQREGVLCANSEDIPLDDSSVNSIMFDPPFLACSGKSLSDDDAKSNIITKRFSSYYSEKLLHEYYSKSLKEFYRLSKDKGILIFKCQDKVSSGKQYFSHIQVYNEAIKIGWYAKDLFILLAKNRIISSKHKNQQHARKFHSYFWVFKKEIKNLNIQGL